MANSSQKMFSFFQKDDSQIGKTRIKERVYGDSEDLIEIVNTLQDKLSASGHTLNISLPQIVVVGCQSAGKSSVLENIVGREFLPRGSGVVTRRPTIVQLQPCDEEYAVFFHKPGKKFTDFQDVKTEITEETSRDPGPVGFSSVPILLKIYSPKVLKLTLVDLPGLIRVTVGDQSEDSITEVRKMVLQYISQEKSLILAVSPANQDIANSDALEIAKTVDPNRIRTIGVLTKLDLMDEGTDARDILENKKIPLKRGYVGVLNRSQKDIEDQRDIDYSLDKEKHFFATMPCYKHIADRMGTPYLKKTLNKQLYVHIKEYLPSVHKELAQKLRSLRKQLKDFFSEIGRDMKDDFGLKFYMVKLIQKFTERFQIEIFGYSEQVASDELSSGAMINFQLYKNIQKNFKLPEIPDEKKLLTIMANLHGVRNCLSLPSLALETAANELLSQYIEPLNFLVDSIGDILVTQVENSSKVLNPYPNLKSEVVNFIRNCISEGASDTKDVIEKHMQAEMYFVNTYHQDFSNPDDHKVEAFFPMKLWDSSVMKDIDDVSSSESSIVSENLDFDQMDAIDLIASNECAKSNAKILRETIQKYISIQLKHIKDIAFKYILFFLVKKVMDFVKTDLLPTVLEAADTESILKDCEKDFKRMKKIETDCKCIEDALSALQMF